MKVHRILLVLALAAVPFMGLSQEAQTVKVSARGADVRTVVHDLFQQAKKNYILDPDVKLDLFMSLNDIEFEEAFELVCKTAGLTYEVQNGIYFIRAIADGPARPKTTAKPEPKSEPIKTEHKAPVKEPVKEPVKPRQTTDPLPTIPTVGGKTVVVPAKVATPTPAKTLDKSVLAKRITTRLQKVDLRVLAAELTKQTGVQIEVEESVPGYRMDAILLRTSLKYALDRITKVAGLNYIFTDRNSILIQNGTASKGS